MLVPGLAVAGDGMRLGRGGGSYDRALGRVPVGTFTCVLLYDDEVGLDVPVEPHDRPVAAPPVGVTVSAVEARGCTAVGTEPRPSRPPLRSGVVRGRLEGEDVVAGGRRRRRG